MCSDYPSIIPQEVFFVETFLKLMISFQNGHEIHHLTNNQLFPDSALWQQLAVQEVLLENDIAH